MALYDPAVYRGYELQIRHPQRPLDLFPQTPSSASYNVPGAYTKISDCSLKTAEIMSNSDLGDASIKLADSTTELAAEEAMGKYLAVLNELKARPSTAVMGVNDSTTAEDIIEWLVKACDNDSKLEFVLRNSDDSGSMIELWTEVLDLIDETEEAVPRRVSDIDNQSLVLTVPTHAHDFVAGQGTSMFSRALSRIPGYVSVFAYDRRNSNSRTENRSLADGGSSFKPEKIIHYPIEVGYSQTMAELRHKMMVQRHLVPGIKLFMLFALFDDKFQPCDEEFEGAFTIQCEIWEPTVSGDHFAESTCGFGPLPSKGYRCPIAKAKPTVLENDSDIQGILRAASYPDTDQARDAIAAFVEAVDLRPNDADEGPYSDDWVELDTESGVIAHVFQPAGIRSADRCFDLVRRKAYIGRFSEALDDPVKMIIIGPNNEMLDPTAERALEFDLAPYSGEGAYVLRFDEFFQQIFKDRFGADYNQQLLQFVEDPEEHIRAFGLDGRTWLQFKSQRLCRRQSRECEGSRNIENTIRERERQEIEFEQTEQARLWELGAFQMPVLERELIGISHEEAMENVSRYNHLSEADFDRLIHLSQEADDPEDIDYHPSSSESDDSRDSDFPMDEDRYDEDYEDDGE